MKITKTMSIAGRLDICSFATLARAYEDEGMRMRSKSDILWQAVEQLAKAYCEKQEVQPFTEIRDAVEYMSSIGISLETNLRAIREISSAKIFQDAGEDYGIRSLSGNAKNISMRGIRREEKLSLDNEKEIYRMAAEAISAQGIIPPTFEEFRENKRTMENQGSIESRPVDVDGDDVVRETTDPIKFAEKEKKRLREEKAAFSPDALRAMVSGRQANEVSVGDSDVDKKC